MATSGIETIPVPASTRILLFALGGLMLALGALFPVLPVFDGSRPLSGTLWLAGSFVGGGLATVALGLWLARPWVTLTEDALVLRHRGPWRGLGRTDLIVRRDEVIRVERRSELVGAFGLWAAVESYALALASGTHVVLGQDYAPGNPLSRRMTPPFWGMVAERIACWLCHPIVRVAPTTGLNASARRARSWDRTRLEPERLGGVARNSRARRRVRNTLLLGALALTIATGMLELFGR